MIDQTTMQAVQIAEYGDAGVLSLVTIPTPSISAGEVLIRVHAAGVNPVDWKIREGYLEAMLDHQLPLTLGWDVAGEIVEVADDISDWSLGDAVYSRPNISRNGAYAEYITVDANEIAAKPSSLDWIHAAAVPLVALTAWQALYESANIKAGDRVLIQAGAGGVGGFAIQLAKLRGAYVISTSSSKNADYLSSLGVDEIIDYKQQDFSALRDLDVVFDTLGGEAQDKAWQTLKSGGTLVSIASPPDEAKAAQYGVKGAFVFVQPNQSQLQSLAELIDAGKLTITIDSIYPLEQVAQAHAKSESNRAKGKIILQVV